MTPTATTTAIIALGTTMANDIGPQVLLLLVGILSALFIYVLGRKGLKKVWGKITKI